MTKAEDNCALIEGFWHDLYQQDFETLVTRFDPRGEYTDDSLPMTMWLAEAPRSPHD